jgi:hypothetical protein
MFGDTHLNRLYACAGIELQSITTSRALRYKPSGTGRAKYHTEHHHVLSLCLTYMHKLLNEIRVREDKRNSPSVQVLKMMERRNLSLFLPSHFISFFLTVLIWARTQPKMLFLSLSCRIAGRVHTTTTWERSGAETVLTDAGLEVLTVVIVKNSMFWYMTSCGLLKVNRRIGGIC